MSRTRRHISEPAHSNAHWWKTDPVTRCRCAWRADFGHYQRPVTTPTGPAKPSGSRHRQKCLVVIHYPVFGGPHNEALRLRGALAQRGWDLEVLLPEAPGNAAQRLRAGGVSVIQMPLHRARLSRDVRVHWSLMRMFLREVATIRDIIHGRRIDVVVVAGLVNPHGAVGARLAGVPIVWQILDSRTPAAIRTIAMPVVHRLADAVMFNGASLRNLHDQRVTAGRPVVVYTPPVDVTLFIPSEERRSATRERFGIPQDAAVVGTVANLNPQKGIEYFIRSASIIYRSRPDAWFIVVGAHHETHSEYLSRLEREIRATGLPAERFIFTGDRSDVENYYPAMDVKLITSVPRSEGTTTTALEAMACGVPVVAVDVGAIRDVIADGVTGLIVAPLDVYAIARAALRILADRVLAVSVREAGRQRVLSRHSIEASATSYLASYRGAMLRRRVRASDFLDRAPPEKTPAPLLQELIICPFCRRPVQWSTRSVSCPTCRTRYPIIDGIPVLLAGTSTQGSGASMSMRESDQKVNQAAFFDLEQDPDFETTRPHGTPALYRWLMQEKFVRGVTGLECLVPGSTVVSVCGGSGMDAEFLARAGAAVVSVDLSLGACQRARERAQRYGLAIAPVVADAERLPLGDASVALSYVHDGLHHLEDPLRGLREMARVAAIGVSVNEPARAAVTALAVRLGLALEVEEAGNRVGRLTMSEVARVLQQEGYEVVAPHRYAMYYRHEPGSVTRALSRRRLARALRVAFAAGNTAFGRFGNKLTVHGVRRRTAP